MSFSTAVIRLAPRSLRPARLSREGISWPAAIAIALMAAGIPLWWLSLSGIALTRMTDVGLGSVLPIGTWVSIGMVTVACAAAWQSGSEPVMLTGILSTILVLFGLGVLGEPTMRFATTWQHVGIANYIATTGSVDPHIDAYFNWPGFFILSAFLSSAAGLKNIEPIARIAPLFFNAMYLIPLVAIGRSLFVDRRVIWLGVWLFFVNNWIGQDYYSPQGLGFFMYLVVIALLLRWFKGTPPTAFATGKRLAGFAFPLRLPHTLTRNRTLIADVRSMPSQRVVLIVAIIVITTAVAASHQFTPFAMTSATAALVLVGWSRLRTLPLGIVMITLLWAAYMAATYLSGHLHSLVSEVGAVNSTVNANVGGRLHGSAGHELIVKLRLITTALLWAVATLGFLRRARSGHLNVALLALAISAFPLLALQSYGGEAILRIALVTMPFMAFSAACAFVPGDSEAAVSELPGRAWHVSASCWSRCSPSIDTATSGWTTSRRMSSQACRRYTAWRPPDPISTPPTTLCPGDI